MRVVPCSSKNLLRTGYIGIFVEGLTSEDIQKRRYGHLDTFFVDVRTNAAAVTVQQKASSRGGHGTGERVQNQTYGRAVLGNQSLEKCSILLLRKNSLRFPALEEFWTVNDFRSWDPWDVVYCVRLTWEG